MKIVPFSAYKRVNILNNKPQDIKIVIALHKRYWVPQDAVYLPLQVGRAINEDLGLTGDDTGDNISNRNAKYCELTALYWAWKNLRADYVGLVHYRRHFGKAGLFDNVTKKQAAVFTKNDFQKYLVDCDCLLPVKRNYYIETVRSQFEHAHDKLILAETEAILLALYPDYQDAFTTVMSRRSLHICNMFVMKRALLDAYCEFIFSILFELERRVTNQYHWDESRIYGFLGERLFDVWLEKNKIEYKEAGVIMFEPVNWPRKIGNFVKRKLVKL